MEDKIICFCSNVSEQEIRNAINNGAKTIEDIREVTGACTVARCEELSPRKRCCSKEIVEILNEYK